MIAGRARHARETTAIRGRVERESTPMNLAGSIVARHVQCRGFICPSTEINQRLHLVKLGLRRVNVMQVPDILCEIVAQLILPSDDLRRLPRGVVPQDVRECCAREGCAERVDARYLVVWVYLCPLLVLVGVGQGVGRELYLKHQ